MFDPKSHIGEVHGVFTIVEMLDEKINTGIGSIKVFVINADM